MAQQPKPGVHVPEEDVIAEIGTDDLNSMGLLPDEIAFSVPGEEGEDVIGIEPIIRFDEPVRNPMPTVSIVKSTGQVTLPTTMTTGKRKTRRQQWT